MGSAADIEGRLRDWLSDGTFVPGQRLPSERTLIDRLGASRNTVRLALARLIADGSIRSEHGRGYFVCPPRRADPDIKRWKATSSALVAEGPHFDIERRELGPAAGQGKHTYVLRSPSTVMTAVRTADDHLLMVWRQHDATGATSWELPGGVIEDGENPESAAARTTKALTGVTPTGLRHVIGYHPLADVTDARHELYVGWGSDEKPARTSEPGDCQPEWIALSELPGLIADNRVTSATSVIAIMAVFASRSPEVLRSLKWVNSFRAEP